ncbi:hypothetical protein [Streptomyces sp. SID161]|nr:hypothetical protein [Streptomyces sp. SID161]
MPGSPMEWPLELFVPVLHVLSVLFVVAEWWWRRYQRTPRP